MNDMFYNPDVMQNPGTILTGVKVADTSDIFIKMHLKHDKVYSTRAEALTEHSFCQVLFYEEGVLYTALRIGKWQWKPCEDVACNYGINWDTYYAKTVERLHEYLTTRYKSICDFKPRLNDNGLYVIQVHYDGRCR